MRCAPDKISSPVKRCAWRLEKRRAQTSHKHVVAVGKPRVVGIGHRVEGADGERKFVEHVKVRVVLFAHELAEAFLVCGAQILFVAHLDSNFSQHFHALVEPLICPIGADCGLSPSCRTYCRISGSSPNLNDSLGHWLAIVAISTANLSRKCLNTAIIVAATVCIACKRAARLKHSASCQQTS